MDEWQSALKLCTAQRELIARTVPTTAEGHFFKLALFITDQADGLDVEEWEDIREAMNGLPSIPVWKRHVPQPETDGGSDAE